MCGRFVQSSRPGVYARQFGIPGSTGSSAIGPRYNIAPTQPVLVVRHDPSQGNYLGMVRWGLVPFWAKEWTGRSVLFNARAEGIEGKPSFQGPLRYRRCLVPCDGFYEWKPKGRTRQPYFFHPVKSEPFALAGVWDHWQGPGGEALESCAIIVTEANEVVGAVHDRMPVILPRDQWALWLDPAVQRPDEVLPLLRPCPSGIVVARPVSTRVNRATEDDVGLIASLDTKEDSAPG